MPGTAADAHTASATGPRVKITSSPLLMSVATMARGISASSMFTSPRYSSISSRNESVEKKPVLFSLKVVTLDMLSRRAKLPIVAVSTLKA